MEKYSDEIVVELPFLLGRSYSVCGVTLHVFHDPYLHEDEMVAVYPNGDMQKLVVP